MARLDVGSDLPHATYSVKRFDPPTYKVITALRCAFEANISPILLILIGLKHSLKHQQVITEMFQNVRQNS